MSKSILVIDTPKNCEGCPLHHFVLDEVLNEWFVSCQLDTFIDEDKKRPSQCPLRPLPKREKANKGTSGEFKTIDKAWTQGFNDCLAEITGETERSFIYQMN